MSSFGWDPSNRDPGSLLFSANPGADRGFAGASVGASSHLTWVHHNHELSREVH